MPRILKDATIFKTKTHRLAADAKIETRRLTAEIFVSGGRRIITIRLDQKVAGHLSEWQNEWYYRPSGVPSAKSQPAIGSTEEEVLDWWIQSQSFQIVEDKLPASTRQIALSSAERSELEIHLALKVERAAASASIFEKETHDHYHN